MSKRQYIDYKLIERFPNKYNLHPADIRHLKVKDWDRLKSYTWFNKAMNKPCWCHLEGCSLVNKYDDFDEFWIGFYEDGKVDYHFSANEGMCSYKFSAFYSMRSIENVWDMNVQVNVIKYLNHLLDEGIVELEKNE